MTGNAVRKTIAAAAVLAAVGGVTGVAATAASASTEPQLCKDMDVRVTATPAQDSPSGHRAVTLHYTAADANTHCTLSGAPYGATFYNRFGSPVGVQSSVANGGTPGQVTIDANHSASSAVLIPNSPEPGPAEVTGLRFHLPSDASNTPVGVAWPGTALSGSPQFTAISQD
ncbi:hypothetical protein [Sciscionella marina]|uniref:hypothetical protein n=1 Tax=Sciscionella marina TaxID=508770 RepID=UPI00037CF889|nr:hypothetical protein [Sciscionella marina]